MVLLLFFWLQKEIEDLEIYRGFLFLVAKSDVLQNLQKGLGGPGGLIGFILGIKIVG